MYTLKDICNCSIGLLLTLLVMSFSFSVNAKVKYKHESATHYNKLIYYSQFKRLSTENKKRYMANVRKIVLDYEKTFSHKKYSELFNFILPTANANKFAKINDYCHTGGIGLKRQGEGKYCPTKGRNCDRSGSDDNFKCGLIYNSACVKRTPVHTISKRCYDEAGDVLPKNEATYRKYEKVINDIAVGQCGESSRRGVDTSTNAPCNLMLARIYSIKTAYGDVADNDDTQIAEPVNEPYPIPVGSFDSINISDTQPAAKPAPVKVAQNSCPTKLGNCYSPLVVKPGKASFNNIEINSDYCGDNKDISFTDSRGVQTSFYLGSDGKLCRKVSAPNARIKRKLDNHNKLLLGSIDSRTCSKDIISCTGDMINGGKDGFENKILDKINEMDRSLFVSAGLCGRQCPTDIAKRSCKSVLRDWNNFVTSPGGVLIRRGKKIKDILRRTSDSKGEALSSSSLNSQSSKTKKKVYKLCLKAFPKRKELCVKDNYGMLVSNVRQAYKQNYKLDKGQVINVKNLKSLVEQTKRANDNFRETTKAKYDQKMNKCLEAIAGLTIKVDDLSNVKSLKPKVLCGNELAKAPSLDKDLAYRTDSIYGKGGKVLGKIIIENNKVKINSSPASKSSIELDFNKERVAINQFTTSNGAGTLDGQFLIDYNSCNDFKSEGFLCNEPQTKVGGLNLSNFKLKRAKVGNQNCIVAAAINSNVPTELPGARVLENSN